MVCDISAAKDEVEGNIWRREAVKSSLKISPLWSTSSKPCKSSTIRTVVYVSGVTFSQLQVTVFIISITTTNNNNDTNKNCNC